MEQYLLGVVRRGHGLWSNVVFSAVGSPGLQHDIATRNLSELLRQCAQGINWRVADSLALRRFLGYGLTDRTADHSAASRTRRMIDAETYQEVFSWILQVLAKWQVLDGKTLGVDATTLEANAALWGIVRRDTKESHQEFLTRLAKASGIETPTREDLARVDKNRKKQGLEQEPGASARSGREDHDDEEQ